MTQASRIRVPTERAGAFIEGAPTIPPLAERIGQFRSLGGNCEFGFVQRYCGAEPSGLFRFSYLPIQDLIHALSTDFAEFGAPGDLNIEEMEGGNYYCTSRRYNIWSNTARTAREVNAAVLLDREYGRVAHLKRRILEELADGSKILVRKVGQGETATDFERLAQAIRRHGPSTLLRVTATGAGWASRPVQRTDDHLLDGSVPRFAPTERAWDLDLEPWIGLCDSAYAATHRIPEMSLEAVPIDEPIRLTKRLRRHAGQHDEPQLDAYTKVVTSAAFDPDKVYVFSTWVWIPQTVSASRIFAVAGADRLGWRDADLGLRRVWQRVWAAGRFRHDQPRAPVGLGMIGTRADRFWSCGARLHEGVVPRRAEPPAVARWLSRWRA